MLKIFVGVKDYLPIMIFFAVAGLIALVALALPAILAKRNPQKAKLGSYECGFDPIGTARQNFDVRFYLVAILFIIFDLEIMFLLPWAITLKKIGVVGFISMMLFLFTLIIGFIYEWKKGALEWE
ncbi:MAG: NADH-quinone oxidoreductase subunit A [Rickettsiaceae bacterium]|nr:NADH-quinone oxidoreductase subunit A [Rickettsiaceae bacterium]